MTERKEILDYGMTLPDVYIDTPFHDDNWILLRYKKNKEHWNTIVLDGSIPDDEVKRMVAESYD